MADPSRPHGAGAEPDDGSLPHSSPPRAPRWGKVSAIIVGVLILLAVILKLTGLGGNHGPGRHTGAPSPAPSSVTDSPATAGGTLDQHMREGGHR